jgi:ElaB/YqjD/DUF883 family membrane-anchored ribosome-binding protein
MTTEPYNPRDTTSDFASKASGQIKAATDRVEGMAGSAMTQGREAAERVEAVAGNVKGAVDKSLKDQPMATLAIAAALGFVLGAIWKS